MVFEALSGCCSSSSHWLMFFKPLVAIAFQALSGYCFKIPQWLLFYKLSVAIVFQALSGYTSFMAIITRQPECLLLCQSNGLPLEPFQGTFP